MNPFKYGCTVAGEYFCPRKELAKRLRGYVESGQNVVIQGERRMGKTSLALETIRSMKGVALFHVDLLCVRDTADLCRRFSSALVRMERKSGFVERIVRSLARLRPTLSLDPDNGSPVISVDLTAANEISSLEAMLDVLLSETGRKRVCVVLDEFQDILDMEDGERVLAVLRSRIQLDSRTPYVFLGSVRNRMADIFWHPDSPFYHSAAAMPVGEIDEVEFYDFICGRFATGRKKISEGVFAKIVKLSRRTPGYIQEFCDAVWDCTEDGAVIDDEILKAALQMIFSREHDHYEIFIRRLTALQMRVLKGIAARGGKEVYSAEFFKAVSVFSPGSIKRALDKLESTGLIYEFEGEYKFVNPFFAEWVAKGNV